MNRIKLILILTLLVISQCQVSANATAKENYKLAYLNINWWKKFNDPMLEEYLIKAYNNNHDLKIASAKIKQGQQMVKLSLGQELPQIQLLADFDRTFRSSITKFGHTAIPEYSQNHFLLPLTMSYEIDIWGKNRLKTKSVKKQLEILKQSERATYISLTSAVAADYYTLVKVDKMLDCQEKILKTQKNILNLTEAKYQNGLAPINEVISEKQYLTLVEDEKNLLEQDRDVLSNQIRTLLAISSDETLERISFDKISMMEIPSQINSEIIENRPDFIISEDQLKKIGLDVKVAKRELLPSFFLSGQIGFNAYEWENIFDGNSFLSSAGIIPHWNVFTGGQKIAWLKFKKYEYEEATQKYEKTILASLQEVNDSLLTAKTAQKNYKGSVERLNLENENYGLISQKYDIGGASKLQRLKAQESLLILQKNEVSNKINCLISAIGLYKAVGGKDLSTLIDEKL